jgi:hypothetical protein
MMRSIICEADARRPASREVGAQAHVGRQRGAAVALRALPRQRRLRTAGLCEQLQLQRSASRGRLQRCGSGRRLEAVAQPRRRRRRRHVLRRRARHARYGSRRHSRSGLLHGRRAHEAHAAQRCIRQRARAGQHAPRQPRRSDRRSSSAVARLPGRSRLHRCSHACHVSDQCRSGGDQLLRAARGGERVRWVRRVPLNAQTRDTAVCTRRNAHDAPSAA